MIVVVHQNICEYIYFKSLCHLTDRVYKKLPVIVIDSDTYAAALIRNADQNHIHGQCRPLAALNGVTVDAVVVGGIGPGALRKLRSRGIRVLKADPGTIGENLQFLADGRLVEFPDNDICAGHGPDGCSR